jgi:hypothetical protein
MGEQKGTEEQAGIKLICVTGDGPDQTIGPASFLKWQASRVLKEYKGGEHGKSRGRSWILKGGAAAAGGQRFQYDN